MRSPCPRAMKDEPEGFSGILRLSASVALARRSWPFPQNHTEDLKERLPTPLGTAANSTQTTFAMRTAEMSSLRYYLCVQTVARGYIFGLGFAHMAVQLEC